MSDNKSMNEWLKDWDALQRQYFNAWSDLAQKAPFAMPPAMPAGFPGAHPFASAPSAPGFPGFSPLGGFASAPAGAGAPWQDGLEQWMRMFAGADKQNETADRLIESAKAYLAMMQSAFGGLPLTGGGAANPAQAWFDALRTGLGTPGAANIPGFDPATNPFAKAIRDVAGKGAQSFAELPAAFAPYLERMRKEGVSWLQMPAFGLTREHQEHYQRTALAFVEYQQALREYNRLMLKASQRGYELFERRLADHAEPGRTIDSLKALYDLWVDAAEDAYAEIALSEEFSKVYGELANAQMRLRQQVQTEVERVSREFGMPTRTELDSLSKRVHDLRREVRDGRVADTGGDRDAEIAALRAEVAALKKSLAPAPAKRAGAPEPAPAKAEAAPSGKSARPAKRERSRRPAQAKSRPPAAVVRPRPAAEAPEGKSAAETTSFAEAVAALQRRVKGKPKLRAAAAQMSKPSKGDKKSAKRRG